MSGELFPFGERLPTSQTGRELAMPRRTGPGSDLSLPERLTVVRTESGLSVAHAKHTELQINTNGYTTSEDNTLIVVSLLNDGTFTFESHVQQWGNRRFGRRDFLTSCGFTCRRLVFAADGIWQSFEPGGSKVRVKPEHLFTQLGKGWFLGEDVTDVQHPQPGEDVFAPHNVLAQQYAAAVLVDHEIVSPAGREALGLGPRDNLPAPQPRPQPPAQR